MAQTKKQRAIAMYNAGYSTGEIARILNVVEATVCRWVGKLY